MTTTNLTLRALCLLCLAAAPIGCAGDKAAEENPNEEACEHLAEGPAVPLTAAASSSASAPAIGNDHKRYDVTLIDVAGARGGFVSFAASTRGEYVVYTSASVQLAVKSATADVAAASTATSIPECADVKGRFAYDLGVGTHIIAVTGASAEKVSFVVEEAAHSH